MLVRQWIKRARRGLKHAFTLLSILHHSNQRPPAATLMPPKIETKCQRIPSSGPRSAAAVGTGNATLEVLNFGLQLLDSCVTVFEVFVQTISFRDQLLLPGAEALLLHLDLFRESFPQSFFLLLELGIVQFAGSNLARLPRLHLLRSIRFIVNFFCRMNEIEHVSSNENGTELLEIAVVFIFNLCYSPCVLASFAGASIACLDIFLGPNDREWHGRDQAACMLETCLFIVLQRWCIDLDALSFDDRAYLKESATLKRIDAIGRPTLCLNLARSKGLSVSALATTGMRLTLVQRRFMTSISNGFSV